ncbi:MAG: HDIG domain-containing protein [Clostridiaceae bacterium]|jgi:cyclic-di-AMP phosphodiesterase PgpH|nr:HDIG domain-containing protein [Clostridiaceae bacterium]
MIKTEFISSLKEFCASIKFKKTLAFFAFTLLLTAIISSQNFFFQNIIENGISKRDIVAQKTLTVVDVQRTEQHKKEVAQKVDPILAPAEDDFIKTNLQTLQSSIIQIRKKNAMPTVKKEEISILFDLSDNSRKDFIIEFLLNADDSSLHEVFDKATVTLNNILQVGITEKDYEKDNIDKIIMGNMVTNVSRRQVSIIKAMLEQVIVPNLVVDDFATEIARKNVQNSVKPYETVFQKGDKILFEGEPVTRLKRDALRQAGYNIYELNTQGLACVYILVFISTLLFLVYMKFFEKTLFEKNHLVIFSVLALTTAAIAAVLPVGTSPYVLPIPALIIIVSIFSNPRVAFVMSTMLLALLTIGFQYDIQFMAAFIMMSLFGVISMSRIQYAKRVDLLKAGVHISLVGIMLISAIYLLEKCLIDVSSFFIIKNIVYVALNGMISSIIALGTLPMFENTFKIVTPYGLAELADPNQPLLKKMFKDAQGTYNHSLMVSSLCEAAAEAIGADPVLARVGALYHDIGKLRRPMFFVENQSYFQIGNPHTNLDNPRLSKMVITAHTKDGVELAKKYGLPPVINNFILQHHGEGLASYFYNKAVQEEGSENVNEEQFRYTGPKPNMKETAILMLADAVESAVRSMKNPTSDEIDAVIDRIIVERLNDTQLSDSPLTLKDIKTIASTFSKMLRGMRHERIKYQENVMEELKKEKINIPKKVFDADLEKKINELESGNVKKSDEGKNDSGN